MMTDEFVDATDGQELTKKKTKLCNKGRKKAAGSREV